MTETGYRRYGMHDLLRRYGRDHAAAGPDHDQALGRLLDYYQYTAATAQDRLARQSRPARRLPRRGHRPWPRCWETPGRHWAGHAPNATAYSPASTTSDHRRQHARVIALTAPSPPARPTPSPTSGPYGG